MSKLFGNHRVQVAAALFMSGVLAACGGDAGSQSRTTERVPQGPQVAVADPVPTTPVETTTPPAPVIRNVSYRDAESVYRKGRYGDAAELFGVYVEEQPDHGQGHYMLGLSAWKSGDHDRAERALQRAVELDGESVKARTNLGRVLLEQGRPHDALPHIEKAVELAAESPEVWRVLGNVKAELSRHDEALDAYRSALVRNENDAWSMNNYALVLIQLGRYQDALPPLARAVELVPGSATFQNNLGVALERAGVLGSARRAFTAALAADSTYGKAQISLSRVQSRLGEAEGEVTDLTTAARMFIEEIQRWRVSDHEC
ncbi:MAG TPA: tetratricopeptide repeat protein [Longimicrobiales bacterium]|nr:tetratricopeptide repeat protein [Longimicrobiales bacterium]